VAAAALRVRRSRGEGWSEGSTVAAVALAKAVKKNKGAEAWLYSIAVTCFSLAGTAPLC
jgi:hypothetical protein